MKFVDIINSTIVTSCGIKKLKGTRTREDYKLTCPDREETRKAIKDVLDEKGLKYEDVLTSKSSVPVLDVWDSDGHHRIVFKPKTGGMAESTLNATITELVPCILFETGLKFEHFGELQDALIELDHTQLGCYVNSKDAHSGLEFLQIAHNSSKFEEKMMNAMAVLKYLEQLDAHKSIQQVYWAYRAKPEGVPSDTPADIVIEYEDGIMEGISLKAGREYTSEPLLNTFVNAVFDFFNRPIEPLRLQLQTLTYDELGVDSANTNRNPAYEIFAKLEEDFPEKYGHLYDQNLEVVKNAVVETFSDVIKFKQFVKRKILKKCDEFPTTVIKVMKDEWTEIEDMTELESFIERAIGVNVRMADTKQGVLVDLIDDNDVIATLSFCVRTNKSGVRHKLGQFHNLAVKFNGLQSNQA